MSVRILAKYITPKTMVVLVYEMLWSQLKMYSMIEEQTSWDSLQKEKLACFVPKTYFIRVNENAISN